MRDRRESEVFFCLAFFFCCCCSYIISILCKQQELHLSRGFFDQSLKDTQLLPFNQNTKEFQDLVTVIQKDFGRTYISKSSILILWINCYGVPKKETKIVLSSLKWVCILVIIFSDPQLEGGGEKQLKNIGNQRRKIPILKNTSQLFYFNRVVVQQKKTTNRYFPITQCLFFLQHSTLPNHCGSGRRISATILLYSYVCLHCKEAKQDYFLGKKKTKMRLYQARWKS